MSNKVAKKAMELAKKKLKQEYGNQPKNVSGKGGKYKGCDFVVKNKKGREIKIEVKGATREYGIPDPYHTEFKKDGTLVADYMYIFYLNKKRNLRLINLFEISRKNFKKEMKKLGGRKKFIKKKIGWVINSRFKKKEVMDKYIQRL